MASFGTPRQMAFFHSDDSTLTPSISNREIALTTAFLFAEMTFLLLFNRVDSSPCVLIEITRSIV